MTCTEPADGLNLNGAQSLCYTAWAKKVNPKCSTQNFVKYWPIFKILSLLQSAVNLQCNGGSLFWPTCRYDANANIHTADATQLDSCVASAVCYCVLRLT